jgi:hypothetical protein
MTLLMGMAWAQWRRNLKLWGIEPDRRALVPGMSAANTNACLARERAALKRPAPPKTQMGEMR